MLSAAFCFLALTPGQAEKPVAIPDADLKILTRPMDPKFKETVEKYDGKLVKLTGDVHYSEGTLTTEGGFSSSRSGANYFMTAGGKPADGRLPLEWANNPKVRDDGQTRTMKAGAEKRGSSVRLTVYGRIISDGRQLFMGVSSISEKHVPPVEKLPKRPPMKKD